MAKTIDLIREWEERERMLVSLVAFFSDGQAKSYAEGCLCATRKCLDDLRDNGEWIKGYEAGARAALR
jgi:hypothetical protein